MTILDNIPFFETLSVSDRQHLSYFCQKQNLDKWEVLFCQWDEPSAFYVITSGSFSVQKTENGVTKELGPVLEWNILWEMALFWENELRNATVIAHEKSEVLTILDFSIQELTKTYPYILKKIQKIIEERK